MTVLYSVMSFLFDLIKNKVANTIPSIKNNTIIFLKYFIFLFFYSSLNASIGLILIAFSAGTKPINVPSPIIIKSAANI